MLLFYVCIEQEYRHLIGLTGTRPSWENLNVFFMCTEFCSINLFKLHPRIITISKTIIVKCDYVEESFFSLIIYVYVYQNYNYSLVVT